MTDHSQVRHGLYARAMDEIYWPNPAAVVVPLHDKAQLYSVAADVIGNEPITYLEFGVYGGWSLTRILDRFAHPAAQFIGFDSFQGLPEGWTPEMGTGHFSTGGAMPDIADPRARFVKGWFQNTLPGFLAAHPVKAPVLVHFDADLYSSTLFLLTTLWHHIPDYYFIFDEFQPDEISAMRDFVNAYPVAFEFMACTQDEYARPQQIFGRMRRIEMVV